ncbi:elongation of very long chain fatty acids protein F [Drosophila willistoni]|uniref:elongation of very long chain fatty acids protein F n=1 Tax=Drosophila willistoni TaxID=7260 RepID=UPI000C26C6C2|nr:elongation of very long chain fatty acids protein F [Drosophila willistoni]
MFEVFDKPYADPVHLPLARDLQPVLLIVFGYLLFVLKLGRQWMAHRQPFQLRGILKIYNVMQILYNGSLLICGLHLIFVESPYNLSCTTVLPLDHRLKLMERTLSYLYYINKLIDLLDTLFFVLRKKDKQITFLHVFHHVFMAVTTFLLIRFYGHGGQVFVTCMLNILIHVVMYSYYYISSQSEHAQQSIWWKKYLTLMQLVQFSIMFSYNLFLYVQPNCESSDGVSITVCSASLFMFIMFSKFYINTYIRSKNKNLKSK